MLIDLELFRSSEIISISCLLYLFSQFFSDSFLICSESPIHKLLDYGGGSSRSARVRHMTPNI